ncbi:ArsR/SmtB family transcription factor [Streptomyces sp. CMB-StM0423]|uniref:ArsR/SmtB family transcription factor n=1 Tax=Streptomyces sp. CMB-StM0423 TaxID=2059884 RepID=UPI000C702D5C|nr:metalloregulator ArsR/SmtB family transcription factor [Streptomyces sp. CMB-StM0423]AUH42055.1 transcriptional regulator [Streptomyces sp. CMB-StM0423]
MPERHTAPSPTRAVHRHEWTPDREQLEAASTVFALLADATRLHLLWLLAEGEADVTELATASGAARPAVSQHLAKLRLANLVHSRKEGRRVVYSLRDGHLRGLVVEALNHADHLMTGEPWHS